MNSLANSIRLNSSKAQVDIPFISLHCYQLFFNNLLVKHNPRYFYYDLYATSHFRDILSLEHFSFFHHLAASDSTRID